MGRNMSWVHREVPTVQKPSHGLLVQLHLRQVMLTCNTTEVRCEHQPPPHSRRLSLWFNKTLIFNSSIITGSLCQPCSQSSTVSKAGAIRNYLQLFLFLPAGQLFTPKGVNDLFGPVSNWSFNTWNARTPQSTSITELDNQMRVIVIHKLCKVDVALRYILS